MLGLTACSWGGLNGSSSSPQQTDLANKFATPSATSVPQETATPLPTAVTPRLLTICLVNEPHSLFLYDVTSTSEQNVLAAVYDGPVDVKDFTAQPIILEKLPALADGDVVFKPVPVEHGDLIVDAQGNLANLADGVLYRPSGCSELSCSVTYSGTDTVQMDQLVVRFKLLAGLQWSDGTPLSAGDSVYSYEVARKLNPPGVPDRLNRTASYKALDDLSVEWTGVPGFVDGFYQTKFFSPLPQHAWAAIPVGDLPSNPLSSRTPLGWGAYVIDEWVAGDHISLHRNPLYFRTAEGLPYFDNLVYRFVADADTALSAVLAGECDLVDQTAGLETKTAALLALRNEGRISLTFQKAFAWDLLEFDTHPLAADRPAFFASPEVRRAVAMCIDRQALVEQLSGGQMEAADMYVPPEHPLYNSKAVQAAYDPQAAATLLSSAGWVDGDNDPSTPRTAQGVPGFADGTSFSVQYLVSDDAERQAAAGLIQSNLQQCGIQVHILAQLPAQYLAAGPAGPVFGRQFDLAQFAWMTAIEPPCSLYLTNEIPGPYPAYPKGWGGVNATGYSNPAYDQACQDAFNSLPDSPQHVEKHAEAQAIFGQDLPAVPLYWHYRVVVGRPDLCNVPSETVTSSNLSDLEIFNYGKNCP